MDGVDKGHVDTSSAICCHQQWTGQCPSKSSVPGVLVMTHHDHDKKKGWNEEISLQAQKKH